MRKIWWVIGVIWLGLTARAQTNEGKNWRGVEAGRFGTAALSFELPAEAQGGDVAELDVVLPGGLVAVRLERQEQWVREGGGSLWSGIAGGRSDSEVVLTFGGGYAAGTIRLGNSLYEVRPSAQGQVLELIDEARFLGCRVLPVAADGRDSGGTVPVEAPVTEGEAGPTIDLLSLYSPEAKAAAGCEAQIETVIQAAVDAANRAFSNSGVQTVYRLVKTAEAVRGDSSDLNLDLEWLASDQAVADLRDRVGADLVSLVVEDGGGFCGMGQVMRHTTGADPTRAAFQVTARGCAIGNLTFAHEHGHQLGMDHDPPNAAPGHKASYPWSFGRAVDGVFRTVMSYSTECPSGCGRVAHFSNPEVAYRGIPTGTSGTNDNARTANLTASVVADFRAAPDAIPKPEREPGLVTLEPADAGYRSTPRSDQRSSVLR